ADAPLKLGAAILLLFKYVAAVSLHVRDVYVPPVMPRVILAFAHSSNPGVAVIVGVNSFSIVTVMFARALSQPATVCDTQYSCVPAVVVIGVGAVALPVPVNSSLYHNKLLPVAVSAGIPVASLQYCKSATPGAE